MGISRGGGFGIGVTPQNVSGSRAFGGTYTNDTGKPLLVFVATGGIAANNATLSVSIKGAAAVAFASNVFGGAQATIGVGGNFIVPPGATYSVTASAGTLQNWTEFR